MKYKLVSLVCLIIGLMTYGCTHTVNILDRPISFDEEIILLDKYLPVIEYHSCEDFLAIPFALYLRTETIAYNEFWKNYDTKFYLYESIGESIEVLVDSNSIFLLTDLSHSASINEIKRLIDINICEYPDNETSKVRNDEQKISLDLLLIVMGHSDILQTGKKYKIQCQFSPPDSTKKSYEVIYDFRIIAHNNYVAWTLGSVIPLLALIYGTGGD